MKIARVKDSNNTETYALISSDEKKLVTRNEIQDQTGIPIPVSIKEFMFNGWLDEVRENCDKLTYSHYVKDLDLLVPIPNPPKILCLAFNYYDHARDAGLTPSDEPVIFMKPRTTLNSPFRDIICPPFVTRLDYEAEIAAVIGKNARKIPEGRSLDVVFGYMILHDVSARDIQFKDKQFTRGKSMDTFAPCGPWITTKDEIQDPQNLSIVTKVNGETRQNSSSMNMVLSIQKIIARLEQCHDYRGWRHYFHRYTRLVLRCQ